MLKQGILWHETFIIFIEFVIYQKYWDYAYVLYICTQYFYMQRVINYL